jgi:hypothetical protein
MVNAQTITMKHDRRFLWLWLVIATSLSVAGNVGHAWLVSSQSDTSKFWMALGWAAAPPALLMLSVHGLPTLARMMEQTRSDRLLSIVVWGVTSGAFVWSAVGIFEFTVAMGVPHTLAWVAPLTIDLSVFGATRGLVLTAHLAARMKLGEKQPAPTKKQTVTQPASPKPPTAKQPPPSGEATLAARVAATAAAKVTEKQIEEILSLTEAGESQRRIAEKVGTNSTTVGRIQNKSRELVAA